MSPATGPSRPLSRVPVEASVVTATLFDFDGVLVDSEPAHLAAFNDVLAPRGLAIAEKDYVQRFLSLDDANVFRAVIARRGLMSVIARMGLRAAIARRGLQVIIARGHRAGQDLQVAAQFGGGLHAALFGFRQHAGKQKLDIA